MITQDIKLKLPFNQVLLIICSEHVFTLMSYSVEVEQKLRKDKTEKTRRETA